MQLTQKAWLREGPRALNSHHKQAKNTRKAIDQRWLRKQCNPFTINASREFVGIVLSSATNNFYAFLRDKAKHALLSPPGATSTFASPDGINDSGTVLGSFTTSVPGQPGFIYSG